MHSILLIISNFNQLKKFQKNTNCKTIITIKKNLSFWSKLVNKLQSNIMKLNISRYSKFSLTPGQSLVITYLWLSNDVQGGKVLTKRMLRKILQTSDSQITNLTAEHTQPMTASYLQADLVMSHSKVSLSGCHPCNHHYKYSSVKIVSNVLLNTELN